MGEAAVKEPSMEDILSSIRKIISEENSSASADADRVQVQNEPVSHNPDAMATGSTDGVNAQQSEAVDATPTQQGSLSDVLNQVRNPENAKAAPVEAAREPASQQTVTPVSPEAPTATQEDLSGINAAKMLSSIATTSPVPEVASVSQTEPVAEVQEEVQEAIPAQSFEAETVSQQPAQSLADIASSVAAKTQTVSPAPEADIHVEMADAEPPQPPQAPSPVVAEESSFAAVDMTSASPATVETMVKEELEFRGALMSPSANSEVSSAFDRLKRSAMDDIDAKTEAILRPMLREWLDENLPNMVERLVREEIERVARGV